MSSYQARRDRKWLKGQLKSVRRELNADHQRLGEVQTELERRNHRLITVFHTYDESGRRIECKEFMLEHCYDYMELQSHDPAWTEELIRRDMQRELTAGIISSGLIQFKAIEEPHHRTKRVCARFVAVTKGPPVENQTRSREADLYAALAAKYPVDLPPGLQHPVVRSEEDRQDLPRGAVPGDADPLR